MFVHKFHTATASLLFFTATAILLCGCIEHRYYVSPFNGNQSTYHPIPYQRDSVKSGYYANIAVAPGNANDNSVDDFITFHGSISGGHNIGRIQTFYAVDAALGSYKAAPTQNIANAGKKFFGGAGFEGGMNAVIPFRDGEWRIFGLETALQNEFGNYQRFRKSIPAEAADLVIADKFFGTVGGYSEYIAYGERVSVGFRLGGGTALGRAYHHVYFYDYNYIEHLRFRYYYFTTHVTTGRYTIYIRANAATKSGSGAFGLNYRLW